MFDIVDLVTKNGQLSQTISCLEVELKKPILSSTIQEKQTLASLPENYRRHLFASLKELMNKLNPITYSDLELKKITQLISEINTLLVKLWVVQVENPSSLNLIPSGKMTQACNTSRLHTDLELINKNINEITTCIAHKNCDEKENRNTKRVLNYLINQHIKNYNQNESGMKLCFDKLLSKTSIKFE
ncbi:hypothetical protein MNBD_GAMMA01-258 [hydrothermal vent metagenome]|uniref:Uncharacterized protein n=1 Tax=hydrothermal vent metagenome TaxID=652676 RepID=A0A3B0V3M5_9ZZZZ